MKKLVVDGKVAVLVSVGFGSGWSTWSSEYSTQMLFDPNVVEAVECGDVPLEDILEYLEETYPNEYFGGYDQLTIEWISEGTKFRIDEYDGAETVIFEDTEYWVTA